MGEITGGQVQGKRVLARDIGRCGKSRVREISGFHRRTGWRRGGLVVSALDFRSGGPWFEPSLCLRVVSLDKKLYSTSCINGYRRL